MYTTYECLTCPGIPEAPIAQLQTGGSKGTLSVTSSKSFADSHHMATGHEIKTVVWTDLKEGA